MEDFNPDSVGRVSKAAKSLCMWACAMDVYSAVAKTVVPKKKALAEAQTTLDAVNAALKIHLEIWTRSRRWRPRSQAQ
jgi:dynein heavy chain